MKLVQIDSPGTWCLNRAFLDMISPIEQIRTFIEVGPGEGSVSKRLCSMGLRGIGIDFSKAIVPVLTRNMKDYIDDGAYSIIEADIMHGDLHVEADLVFSMLVMEHIEEDRKFLNRMEQLANKGGIVLVAVPGRKDKWGMEDEIYGHYRRYDRDSLVELLEESGLEEVKVWSVNVPISNLLFWLSNFTIRTSRAVKKKALTRAEQTKSSGFKDIPYKTLFPRWSKIFLNQHSMYPFYVLQRLFYNTNLGLGLIGSGSVKD